MNYSKIPKGWEKCEIGEAMLLLCLDGNKYPFEMDAIHVTLRQDMLRIEALSFFGITPIRKVEPIEFTVRAHKSIVGVGIAEVQGNNTEVPDSWIGKTFREVI